MIIGRYLLRQILGPFAGVLALVVVVMSFGVPYRSLRKRGPVLGRRLTIRTAGVMLIAGMYDGR